MTKRLEKVTDMIVFNLLQTNNYVDGSFNSIDKNVYVWAKKSSNKEIDEILSTASKKKTGKKGYPEYIIYDTKKNFVIVIEDKRDTNKHVYGDNIENPNLEDGLDEIERVDEYAVNGALWYASKLKSKFDVIAIGVSGNNLIDIKIDTFIWNRNSEIFNNLNIHDIKEIEAYRKLIDSQNKNNDSLKNVVKMNEKAKEINEFLRDYLGVIEHERLYVLGAILFALEDPIFKMTYTRYSNDESLAISIWQTVERKIKGSSLDNKEIVENELKSTLLSLQDAQKEGVKEEYPRGALLELTNRIDKLLYDYHKHGELDIMSVFFNVFLSYSTSGGSDLGIVLTPNHITKLFCDLAEVTLDSKVIDICAGTGGFLTAAWKKIKCNDKYTETQKELFRKNNLFGVEKEKSIYTIVALNMFINKDGRSHIYKGDCFSLKDKLIDFECNVGFINPPYSDSIYSEIEFVELMLDILLPNSIGVAILPINAISSRTKKHNNINVVKSRILQKNNLIASIQTPYNLFYPKGTETIILVFETGVSNYGETWFAKFDDGYELIKHQKTRTPSKSAEKKYEKLLKAYKERKVTDFSFNKSINPEEQWVYTLLSDVNYEITDNDLQGTVNEYISYLFKNNYF